jgi:hypothetical protein
MNKNNANSLDHLVLPVTSLKVARKRLSALGFTVAGDGHHPFGSSNCCVFFDDDSYIEPLAINDATTYNREADAGNRFLQRDRTYRQRNGDDGFSLIALTSKNAAVDKVNFEKLGYDCGRMVSFRRDIEQPDGSSKVISINLFISTTESAPDLALFSCEWLTPKEFDAKHKKHANSALGIAAIALSGSSANLDYLRDVTGQAELTTTEDGQKFTLPNANLALLTPEEFERAYGIEVDENAGLKAQAIDVIVDNIMYVKMILFISGIKSREIGSRLVVAPAEGQGYTLAFIEKPAEKNG